ncbi:DUF2332 domain-containing protein [Rhizobiaceae bacterium BDR2-2]|uniref:DUF2332 domain-containing protein n=1 Tax=Ectorhizobium quercum TaxID=2965071 RepID=A0AAE3SUJ0_9HYPH|nr:DUF2332 domain-containing protein [Ectorhizobium quercum]MCX8996728.1 DUF2332 domain-containing protein [Ectorhizobium quercum]
MNSIAERYRRFARVEAAGRSPLYETLAKHVAGTQHALTFLSRLPRDRQQPNLLFAALRHVCGTPMSITEFDEALGEHAQAIAEVMVTRTTQTNEPGRCAAFLPSLCQMQGPLALIEVGASAGLCLLPDAYGYDWERQQLAPPSQFGAIAPVFHCHASENAPLPLQHPEIVWRAGLDLNPLDLSNHEDVAWLENLIWPEHHERFARLRAAVQVARKNRPRVVAGDLRQDLSGLIAEAPSDATVVVFHTAVLSYIADQNDRDAFARSMIDTGVVWLSNESPGVFPEFAEKAGPIRENMFLLNINGQPVAWTGPHGQELQWL